VQLFPSHATAMMYSVTVLLWLEEFVSALLDMSMLPEQMT